MKAAELADKLDEFGMSVLDYTDFDLILKSLRFAADMEVLRQDGLVVTIYPQSDGSVHLNYDGWDYVGSDIYSAARAAVEALKGRE